MKKTAISISAIALSGALLIPALVPGASGVEGDQVPGSQVLQISPVHRELSVPKGTSTSEEVTITNKSPAPQTLRVSFQNMIANGGNTDDISATDEITPFDLKQWARFSINDFILAPQESRKVTVTITVPPNAEPGGHFGFLRFSPADRTNAQSVAISGSVATMYLVRVPGPASETGDISDFYLTRDDGRKVSGLLLGTDMKAISKLQNTGNVHYVGSPTVTAFNQFGKQVFQNQTRSSNIFPQAYRKYESSWDKISTGYYKVKVKNTFPGSGEKEKTLSVLVVTPRAATFAAIILVLFLIIIVLARRSRGNVRV